MSVFVYRSSNKNNWYLFIRERDVFDNVPQPLLKLLGKLEIALEFDLHPQRKLARGNTDQVIEDLTEKGYHVQIGDPIAAQAAERHH